MSWVAPRPASSLLTGLQLPAALLHESMLPAGLLLAGLLLAALLSGCAAVPARAPLEPSGTLEQFSARRLEQLSPELPAPSAGWDRAQWLTAALRLNPQLAEQRAVVTASAAAERTAAERPNPSAELFAEYLTSVAQSSVWLYGLSLDFLLRAPGERTRARQRAALQTALAQSDLTESVWQVRASLRHALLDAVCEQDQSTLLTSLVSEREALVEGDRRRLTLGDIARTQLLADQLELSRARQRQAQARAQRADAVARLAAAVGVPAAALDAVPLRWDDWAAIDTLTIADAARWRTEALLARPQIAHALREYDLAEIALQSEVAKRWPQLHVTPAYAWGGNGVREDTLNDIAQESALGVSFEVPVFNQHQGAIGEAVARRTAAGKHLMTVQAEIFGQIDRAELAWPSARQAWSEQRSAADVAVRQLQAEQRVLAAGGSDRASVLAAQVVATEAQLSVLAAAYAAEVAFGEVEDAYRRPLQGAESRVLTASLR
jgi:outer membrane protein, heavy metal efflux system